MLNSRVIRLTAALLTFSTLSACQLASRNAPVNNRNGQFPAVTALQAQSNPNFVVDGEGDSVTADVFRDFDGGVLENLNLHTQGYLSLKNDARQGIFMSQPLRAPFAFDALLSSWDSNRPVNIEVRVGSGANALGEWRRVGAEQDLKFSQKATHFQYRVTLQRPANERGEVRFDGINFLFGIQNPNPPRTPQKQAHSIAKPDIVSRQAWGARPPKGRYSPHRPDGIVLHHTWRPTHAQYRKDGSMRGMQNYHMDTKKWSDIGYHFVIGPEGTIYQGRPETVVGAHSSPNTGKIGICIVGDYDPGQDPFTSASREALTQLMTWLTAEYGINTREYYGHRDFSQKSCPGEGVYSQIDALRNEIIQRLRAN